MKIRMPNVLVRFVITIEKKNVLGRYACSMYFAGSKERTKAIKEMKQNIEGCNLEM